MHKGLARATIGDIAAHNGLQTGPFGSQLKASEYVDDIKGIPLIMPKDIAGGHVRVDTVARVSLARANKLTRHKLMAGDILFPRRGELSRIAIITEREAGWLCGTGCLRLRLGQKVCAQYLWQFLQLPVVLQWLEDNAVGQTMLNLNTEIISELPVLFPELREQHAITNILLYWDTTIEKTEKLIEAKEKVLSHAISVHICESKHKRLHVGAIAQEVSVRNPKGFSQRVLSVTNRNGFVLPEDHFERRVASEDVSNYKTVKKGQYAYNPSRINVGSIARLDDFDDGVLSPMYVVFALDETKVDSDYFMHWLASHEARQRIKNSAQGSVRETVSFNEFSAIAFPLPRLGTQQVISAHLNILRKEIALMKKQAEAYRTQKRGLMQKLLTGQWRVKTGEEVE
jgi:type I restriction enzyme S subunit